MHIYKCVCVRIYIYRERERVKPVRERCPDEIAIEEEKEERKMNAMVRYMEA